ncbi:MAG: metal-sensitive transcriptional regulator [Nocardioidaceae bacterium]
MSSCSRTIRGFADQIRLDPAGMTPVVNRIKRARGQLDGVLRMIAESRDCEDVTRARRRVHGSIPRCTVSSRSWFGFRGPAMYAFHDSAVATSRSSFSTCSRAAHPSTCSIA